MSDLLSWAAASFTWLTIVSILWHQDTIAALEIERKAKEEGRLR
jgi:hypothetical protein